MERAGFFRPAFFSIFALLFAIFVNAPLPPIFSLKKGRAFAHAAEFCRTNGLLPKDGIIGSTFYSTREKGRLRHFSHLWIPYERA